MKRRRKDRPSHWPDWFEPKGYPHFDQPIRSPTQVRHIIESPEECARRAFLPFIRFEKLTAKFKRSESPDGSRTGEFIKKARDLKYASHVDSLIFRHYSNQLSELYEARLCDEGIGHSVLAYRRFSPPKCNIDFASQAFEWIKSHSPCVALTFDIRDFFETLSHKLVKQSWREILGGQSLPPDHYNVFKAITRYSWVDRDKLLTALGISKSQLKNFRGPLCTPAQFRQIVRMEHNLITPKPGKAGIPQGSPISALISNIYMLPMDRRMSKLAQVRSGLYFRYSDDILISVPAPYEAELVAALEEEARNLQLTLHDGLGKRSRCSAKFRNDGKLEVQPPLQYLGFSFDGTHARIRSQTIARFFRRMRQAVRREKYLAKQRYKSGGDGRVRRSHLYRDFTHLGSGNFITSYSAKARKTVAYNQIRPQIKRHWDVLHRELNK